MKASVNVYNLDMSRKFSRQTAVDVEANSSTRLFQLPDLQGLSSTYFIDLLLTDSAGKTVSRNFYWLSTSPETLDFDKSTWYVTPTRTFADYTALNRLPTVDLNATARSQAQSTTVTVTNPGKTLAFAVHLAVKHEPGGEEILPVLWQDNYFALLPGESRQVTATYSPVRGTPVVEVDGWNIKAKVVTPAR
jgi:exo-1,4-beta-D-glucosaminidase